MDKVKIGIVGCGNISSIYLQNCTKRFDVLEVAAVADLDLQRAEERAKEYGVSKACSYEEMLLDSEIKIVLNLTVPAVHAKVSLQALEAGKNIYSEKPLAVTREDGQRILETAKAKGLLVGCSPDTFLGGGLQTCRKLLDDGWIGRPVASTAFMMGAGPESWHPNPEFFYERGAGPMFDMGPYYITALISLLGRVSNVAASAQISFKERTITSQPHYGEKINVEVPTYVSGILNFESGVIGNLITSFDVYGGSKLPFIEIYGSEGTINIPDPNFFDGPVLMKRKGYENWSEVPLAFSNTDNSRGIGLADMAYALLSGRKHRANGENAYHVLDIMHGIHEAANNQANCVIKSPAARPSPLPMGLSDRVLDR
jgi:predicted dehydrogenase